MDYITKNKKKKMKTIRRFPNYSVTKDGQVWSKPRKDRLGRHQGGLWLKQALNSHGYYTVILTIKSYRYTCSTHQLVLETYKGSCPVGKECRHLNGIKTDNRLENLCWGTRKENEADKIRHGTTNRGEKGSNVRLTEKQVILIFNAYHAGGYTQRELAKMFKVCESTIQAIVGKKTWKYLWN